MVEDHLRGHPIYFDGKNWRYLDTDERTVFKWKERPCGHCGKNNTPEGHDGCLGTLPDVKNACCGHGNAKEAYIQYFDKSEVRGEDAIKVFTECRKGPN